MTFAVVGEEMDVASRLPPADGNVATFVSDGVEFQLDCLSGISELKALRDEWLALEQAAGDPCTYFQSFDWCHSWCESFLSDDPKGRDMQLRVFTLRREGRLAMIWPFMVKRSMQGLRVLSMLTEPLGQYTNILADHALIDLDIAREAWQQIRLHCDVDAIQIDQLPGGCLMDQVIGDEGWREKTKKEILYLDLGKHSNWDDYQETLSRSQRKQRKRRRNKLEKTGSVDYQVHPGGSPGYRDAVDQALKMKLSWLKETGRRPAALALPQARSFLLNLSGNVEQGSNTPEGALAHVLALDGRMIAIEIGMAHRQRYYSFLGAFDLEFRNYSVGKIQIEFAQQWAMEAGLQQFDFLGDPADYKSNWTGSSHPISSRNIPLTRRGWIHSLVWRTNLRPLTISVFNALPTKPRRSLLRAAAVFSSSQ